MAENDLTSRLKRPALVVLVLYWLFLIVATHIPQPPEVIYQVVASDKWLHVYAYSTLSLLVSFNWALRREFGWRQWIMVWALLAAFGVIDELTQIPVGRECDIRDWRADVIGIAVGITVFEIGRAAVSRLRLIQR